MHEEFVEAIIRLHEEKLGVSQADRDFGIPDDEDDWDYAYDAWGDDDWGGDDTNAEQRDGAAPPGDSPDQVPGPPWQLLLARLPVALMPDNDVCSRTCLSPQQQPLGRSRPLMS